MWRPVAFISKSLSDIERNYEIHNKKMLAVVRYLEVWRHFLKEITIKFKIWIDYKNLEYFIKAQKLNKRQAKWTLYLSRFDFTLKYILGSKMGKIDSLSRRLDWEIGVKRDNKDKMLVKPEWLEVRRTDRVEVIIERVDLLEKVKQSRVKDDEVVKAVKDLIMLSTNNLKYQMIGRRTEKLTERFVGLYKIKKIVLTNAVELELPSTVRIHPVVNISRIYRYIEQVEEQKKKQQALVIIEEEEEQEVERILNKWQIREKDKYLIQWKEFTAKSDTWKGIKNLGNAKEVVEEFEREYQ